MTNPAYVQAQSMVGTTEIPGPQHNPDILRMAKTLGLSWIKDDETPWCAVFVGFCLAQAGFPFLKSARARAYENYGTKAAWPYQEGDLVVMWRGSREGQAGHVGFLVSYDEASGQVLVLGGNQSDQVSYQWYDWDRVLVVRRPVLPTAQHSVSSKQTPDQQTPRQVEPSVRKRQVAPGAKKPAETPTGPGTRGSYAPRQQSPQHPTTQRYEPMRENTKPFWRSKTALASGLSTILGFATATGLVSPEIATELSQRVPELVTGTSAMVLGLVSLWGRLTAKHRLR